MGAEKPRRETIRTLKVKGMDEEEWLARDLAAAEYLQQKKKAFGIARDTDNTTRMLEILMGAIQEVLKDRLTKGSQKESTESPFESFCRRHKEHPDLPLLIQADRAEDNALLATTYLQIKRDAWRDYLDGLNTADTSALFRYLAKEDGRAPRARTYSCAAPLKNPD